MLHKTSGQLDQLFLTNQLVLNTNFSCLYRNSLSQFKPLNVLVGWAIETPSFERQSCESCFVAFAEYQSTAHITGFADDVVPDESPNGVVPSSEILQQLKLRMPWNQPSQAVSTASSSATSTLQVSWLKNLLRSSPARRIFSISSCRCHETSQVRSVL